MKSHLFVATLLIVIGTSALTACSDNSSENAMRDRVSQLEKENADLKAQLETAHKARDFQNSANSAQQAADAADEADEPDQKQ